MVTTLTNLSLSEQNSGGRAEREEIFRAELRLETENEKQREKQVECLACAVQGFAECREPPDTFYKDF